MSLVKSKQRVADHGEVLTGSSAVSAEGSLFADLCKHEIFIAIKTHLPMTVRELAVSMIETMTHVAALRKPMKSELEMPVWLFKPPCYLPYCKL